MPFQLNSKNVFLTYPQCDVSKAAMLYYLIEQSGCSAARIGQEEHQDGTPHLHAYLHSDEGFRTRNERYFDVLGFHPNVQPCRKVSSVLEYVAKTGNFIDYGVLSEGGNKRTWNDVVLAENLADARSIISSDFPRDFVLNNEKVEYWLSKHFKKAEPIHVINPTYLFNPDPIMTQFANQRLDPGKHPQPPPPPQAGELFT